MHRFYIAPEDWNPDALVLTDAEAHHCRNVLRLEPADKVVLFNGQGREITAEIVSSESRGDPSPQIARSPNAAAALPHHAWPGHPEREKHGPDRAEGGRDRRGGNRADSFPIARLSARRRKRRAKQAKWQTIAIEAAKQCGQNWLPEVQTPQTLAQFFRDHRGFDLQLIGSLQSDALHLKKILAEFDTEHGDRPANVLMLVGPEGDFTPAELSLARSHGCRPITLGPIILRVETASIYCLSILSYELLVLGGDLESAPP